jgi:hypothetical protein
MCAVSAGEYVPLGKPEMGDALIEGGAFLLGASDEEGEEPVAARLYPSTASTGLPYCPSIQSTSPFFNPPGPFLSSSPDPDPDSDVDLASSSPSPGPGLASLSGPRASCESRPRHEEPGLS